jgi:hypothetical protein
VSLFQGTVHVRSTNHTKNARRLAHSRSLTGRQWFGLGCNGRP